MEKSTWPKLDPHRASQTEQKIFFILGESSSTQILLHFSINPLPSRMTVIVNNTGPQKKLFFWAVDSSMIFLCITSKNTKKFTGINKIIYFMLLSTRFLRISNFLAP